MQANKQPVKNENCSKVLLFFLLWPKTQQVLQTSKGAAVYMQYKIRVMGNNLSVQLGVMLAAYDLSPIKDHSFKPFTLPSRNQG